MRLLIGVATYGTSVKHLLEKRRKKLCTVWYMAYNVSSSPIKNVKENLMDLSSHYTFLEWGLSYQLTLYHLGFIGLMGNCLVKSIAHV